MRYEGQIHLVDVPFDMRTGGDLTADLRSGFEARYSEIFFHLQKRREVVLENLRAAAVGRLEKPSLQPIQGSNATHSLGKRAVYFGEWTDAEVYNLNALSPGQRLGGPTLLESEMTTVVVPSGAQALTDLWGNVRISAAERRT
jgi:N-methylhydantoinase A